MTEKTKKSYKHMLTFEKSGEILSIEISIDNISPSTKKDTINDFLKTMFERLIAQL